MVRASSWSGTRPGEAHRARHYPGSVPAWSPPASAPEGAHREALPLRPGARGAAVVDLQARLARLGLPCDGEADDEPRTEQSVRQFQAERRIRIDGVRGPQTWNALVDAGWQLGDRLLYERSPMSGR